MHPKIHRLLREVTGTPEGEKVRISCWFLTHRHGDHHTGFTRFLNQNQDQVVIERMLYNLRNTDSDIDRIRNLVEQNNPNILYHKPHTGETIQLADVTFDVLHTIEDQVSTKTGTILTQDYNNTCTILHIGFDGAKLMLTGDAALSVERMLIKTYSESELKSDILQVAHHGFNLLSKLYAATQAPIS